MLNGEEEEEEEEEEVDMYSKEYSSFWRKNVSFIRNTETIAHSIEESTIVKRIVCTVGEK